mmetsp:Transcript_89866/g.288126  ORF Transcript_89866/g.288126 Transcript_89866/m.288126 type:complete len:85 (+) Transcript_89866:2039-2293(+)
MDVIESTMASTWPSRSSYGYTAQVCSDPYGRRSASGPTLVAGAGSGTGGRDPTAAAAAAAAKAPTPIMHGPPPGAGQPSGEGEP